jgi:hypothetical protein
MTAGCTASLMLRETGGIFQGLHRRHHKICSKTIEDDGFCEGSALLTREACLPVCIYGIVLMLFLKMETCVLEYIYIYIYMYQ